MKFGTCITNLNNFTLIFWTIDIPQEIKDDFHDGHTHNEKNFSDTDTSYSESANADMSVIFTYIYIICYILK